MSFFLVCVIPVGEPINHEAWEWLHKVVGDSKCTLVDTWWQTGKSVSQERHQGPPGTRAGLAPGAFPAATVRSCYCAESMGLSTEGGGSGVRRENVGSTP